MVITWPCVTYIAVQWVIHMPHWKNGTLLISLPIRNLSENNIMRIILKPLLFLKL